MRDVMYVAYIEYVDSVIGLVGDGFGSADDAEKAARERLSSFVVAEHLVREHGGVKAIMVRESREVRRIEL